MPETKRIPGLGLAALVSLMMVALAAPAEPPGSAEADDAEAIAVARGRTTYRVYCQNCHGKGALGDGPIAELLRVRPADLTAISQRRGGVFPAREIHDVIDGRKEVKGHGSREMPIWGLSFRDPGLDSDQEEEVRGRIRDLVAYLQTIQIDGEETE